MTSLKKYSIINKSFGTQDVLDMQEWRNGRRIRLKIWRWQQCVGSSPISCTKNINSRSKDLLFFVLKAERSLYPGYKVSAPLRSAQSRRPPDVLRPISCLRKPLITWFFDAHDYKVINKFQKGTIAYMLDIKISSLS